VLGAGGAWRGLDRRLDARSHREPGTADHPRRHFSAFLEVGNRHTMSVAMAMHVAGLQSIKLGKAGIAKASRDGVFLRSGQAPFWPSRRVGARAASRKASTT